MWHNGWEDWTEGNKDGMPFWLLFLWAVWLGKCRTYKLQFSQYCIMGNCEHENSLKMIGYSDRRYKIIYIHTHTHSFYLFIFHWCGKNIQMEYGVSATIAISNVQGLKNTRYPQVLGLMWHYFGFTISGLKNWDTPWLVSAFQFSSARLYLLIWS